MKRIMLLVCGLLGSCVDTNRPVSPAAMGRLEGEGVRTGAMFPESYPGKLRPQGRYASDAAYGNQAPSVRAAVRSGGGQNQDGSVAVAAAMEKQLQYQKERDQAAELQRFWDARNSKMAADAASNTGMHAIEARTAPSGGVNASPRPPSTPAPVRSNSSSTGSEQPRDVVPRQCAKVMAGVQCENVAVPGSLYCYRHN